MSNPVAMPTVTNRNHFEGSLAFEKNANSFDEEFESGGSEPTGDCPSEAHSLFDPGGLPPVFSSQPTRLSKLIRTCLDDLSLQKARVGKALEDVDHGKIATLLHSLKGVAQNVCLQRLANLLEDQESGLRSAPESYTASDGVRLLRMIDETIVVLQYEVAKLEH